MVLDGVEYCLVLLLIKRKVLPSTTENEMNKTQSLRANVDKEEKAELEKIATILDVPEAQIIREGFREKMVKLRKHPKVKAAVEAVEVV